MLEKVTVQIFSEKKMKRMIKLSKISFFLGILLTIAFPLLSENIKIEEKQLRNTALFSHKISNSQFSSYYRAYFSQPDSNDETYSFCTQIFNNTRNIPYNKIFTKNIISPRGKKQHLIQINLIYDKIKNLEKTKKSNFVFYALIKFLTEKNNKNILWLSKDIQINYITKELFDTKAEECIDLLTKGKHNERIEQGKYISAIYNFDLSEIDIENLNTFLIKIVGINSEHVDIDFYKMIIANFQVNFNNMEYKITTNEPVLSQQTRNNFLSVLSNFNDVIKQLYPKKEYKNKYIYIIENILNNFFLINNDINTNHLLVTQNFNSILIKTIGLPKNLSRDRKINSYYNLIGTILLMIKGMSVEEIDIFRGLYFYILSSPTQCIGYFYLFVLIFMTIREFFYLVELIYHNEYKFIWSSKAYLEEDKNNNENNNDNIIYGSKIIGCLFFMSIGYIFVVINIEKIKEILNIENLVFLYYGIIGNIFMNQLFILALLGLNKAEEKFINIILMYILVLNCWNFVFINPGIGLVMTVIIMPMEFIFLNLKLIKYCFIKIIILGIILYGIMNWNELINSMVSNYIRYNNNIYTIITFTMILLTLRLALCITMLMNKFKRGESWNFDEVNELEDIIEDNDNNKEMDNKEDNEKNDNNNNNEEDDNNNEEEIQEIRELKEIEDNNEENEIQEIREIRNIDDNNDDNE